MVTHSQVPKSIPAWQAAYIEPLACAIHAVELGKWIVIHCNSPWVYIPCHLYTVYKSSCCIVLVPLFRCKAVVEYNWLFYRCIEYSVGFLKVLYIYYFQPLMGTQCLDSLSKFIVASVVDFCYSEWMCIVHIMQKVIVYNCTMLILL